MTTFFYGFLFEMNKMNDINGYFASYVMTQLAEMEWCACIERIIESIRFSRSDFCVEFLRISHQELGQLSSISYYDGRRSVPLWNSI